jgi:DNA-binding transcriptional ArsR family regulator
MDSDRIILAMAALAQPTRLDAFRLLVKYEPEGLPAGEIAEALAVPHNTLSAHLAVLSRAGLVTSRRSSRSIVYRADLRAVRNMTLFLLQDCCGGRPEVCAPLIDSLAPCSPPRIEKRRTRTRA